MSKRVVLDAVKMCSTWLPPDGRFMEWEFTMAHIRETQDPSTLLREWTDWPTGAGNDPRIFVFHGCEATRLDDHRTCGDKDAGEQMQACGKVSTISLPTWEATC